MLLSLIHILSTKSTITSTPTNCSLLTVGIVRQPHRWIVFDFYTAFVLILIMYADLCSHNGFHSVFQILINQHQGIIRFLLKRSWRTVPVARYLTNVSVYFIQLSKSCGKSVLLSCKSRCLSLIHIFPGSGQTVFMAHRLPPLYGNSRTYSDCLRQELLTLLPGIKFPTFM